MRGGGWGSGGERSCDGVGRLSCEERDGRG